MANSDILKRIGVSGYNKPKKTSGHATKSHVVVAKSGNTVKTIRFGQQGVSGAGSNPSTKKNKNTQVSLLGLLSQTTNLLLLMV